jgi:L-threonylcarbamoyladenylate synthase
MNDINKAVEVLMKGGVVAYPTDTAYGLAVDATNLKAIRRLYQVKGRDYNKPISVIFPTVKEAEKFVRFNKVARKMADAYWPGELTLVLPVRLGASKALDALTAKTGSLGVRHPNSDIAMELVTKLGRPITATSANISGKPAAYTVSEIKKQFSRAKDKPDYYLDGGILPQNALSTMLHVDGKHVTLLREGVVNYHDVIKILS